MPYVDEQYGICSPLEKPVEVGDIVAVKPFTATVNGRNVVFPPLSIASTKCIRKVQFTVWIDGVRVRKEDLEIREGNVEASGQIEVRSKEFLPGFTARKLLGETRLKLNPEKEGVDVVALDGLPVISVKGSKVILHTKERLDVLLPLAYSLLYFLSSEYSEDI